MGIITLTTDLGHKDFYQAALKGSIISQFPAVRLVDISHEIPPFDIQYAAFVLKNAYAYFPEKTVHLIGIDSVFNENARYLAVQFNGHYFVGADNGIFSLILDGPPAAIVELNIIQDLKYLHFPLTDIFAKAACHIASGGELREIGDPVNTVVDRTLVQPVVEKDSLRGSVVFIDSFGNVISNISKELFNKVQQGRDFVVYFRRNETIDQLSWHYNEVPEGEKLCLFGISNYLEIAINKGNASGLLGLGKGDIIRVEFKK
ncbi:S-adenosyl-l-methionine hydroxide adenosyltransferase family protein [Parapedobacter deserti]|uniref:S-adenosyl-l-methionine hydroxide adenosyltransferase family protein n=1 Tax=Parapedobacter deserti TaxID=1912957 RepID=A0ABV7JN62_9SPHI